MIAVDLTDEMPEGKQGGRSAAVFDGSETFIFEQRVLLEVRKIRKPYAPSQMMITITTLLGQIDSSDAESVLTYYL